MQLDSGVSGDEFEQGRKARIRQHPRRNDQPVHDAGHRHGLCPGVDDVSAARVQEAVGPQLQRGVGGMRALLADLDPQQRVRDGPGQGEICTAQQQQPAAEPRAIFGGGGRWEHGSGRRRGRRPVHRIRGVPETFPPVGELGWSRVGPARRRADPVAAARQRPGCGRGLGLMHAQFAGPPLDLRQVRLGGGFDQQRGAHPLQLGELAPRARLPVAIRAACSCSCSTSSMASRKAATTSGENDHAGARKSSGGPEPGPQPGNASGR